jgi:hypothetical protein
MRTVAPARTCACRATDASASTKLLLNEPTHMSTTPTTPPTNCRLKAAATDEAAARVVTIKRRETVTNEGQSRQGARQGAESAWSMCSRTTRPAAVTAAESRVACQHGSAKGVTVCKCEEMQRRHFGEEAGGIGCSGFATGDDLAIVTIQSHTSCITRHTSYVTRHTPHVTHHTSHATSTRHTSHITRHTLLVHVTRHTSHVTHHTSHVTRHTSSGYRASCSHRAEKKVNGGDRGRRKKRKGKEEEEKQ